jgi:small-conductance mechanosensitive channel
VINPLIIPLLYVLGILVAVDVVRQTLGNVQLIRVVLQILETVAALGAIVWLLRRLRPQGEAAGPTRFNILRLGAYLSLFILAVGLVAGASGYVLLASLVTTGILALSALALALYAGIRVLSGLLAFALRVWPFRTLEMVKQHRALLERRVYGVLVLVAFATWVSRFLSVIGLREQTLSLITSILYARLERGSISISLLDVLAFVITVWIASLVSSFIRFALQEDVFPRMRVAPGSSYAISSLLHYFILAFGVVVGLGVMGVNLTSVSVLAGALGVGIGFGLQSVVNNFISGLILLFEQPVHVGDTIEVGDLQGEIRRIGIRASIVRTWHGADIIVPNAQFITEKVTNWTFRDQLRRIDLPVGVNYGAAPKQVIELLEKVAEANTRVMRNPPPKCLFVGYGDSTINFELRAWTDQFYNWQQIRSELAMAVYDAVYAAGMTFPFPQRDVHIIQDAQPEKKE